MTFVAAAIGGLAGYGVAGTAAGALLGAGLGASLGGSMNQAQAAKEAAQTQYAGTQYAADIQKQMFDVLNAQQAPYREIAAGEGGALTQIKKLLPYFTRQPTAADIQSMPGYQFAVEQGTKAANQAANVLSPGSTQQQAIGKFISDYTLGTALPQYLNTRTDIYNTLAGIAGLGQKATQATGQLGQSTGQTLGQLATGGATALAGGQIGAANAMASGLGQLGNYGTLYSLLNPSTAAVTASPAISSNFMQGQFNPTA